MKTSCIKVGNTEFDCIGSKESMNGILSYLDKNNVQTPTIALAEIIYRGIHAYARDRKTGNEVAAYNKALHRSGLLVNEDIFQLAAFYEDPEKFSFQLPDKDNFQKRRESFLAIFQ